MGLKRLPLLPVLGLLTAFVTAPVAETQVRADLQVTLFGKILTYDRALTGRVGEELTIAIVFQAQVRESRDAMLAMVAASEAGGLVTVGGLPMRLEPVPYEGAERFEALLGTGVFDIAYIAPMRSVSIATIAKSAEANGLLTITGVPEYMGRGIAVGLADRDGRASILIDREAAERQGANFDAQLLQLATLVEPDGEDP